MLLRRILTKNIFSTSFLRAMSGVNIYVTRPDIPETGLEMLKEKGYNLSIWNEKRPVPREELLKQIKNKHGLFCLLTDKIDTQILNSAGPELKVIATMSVGYEHLSVDEIKNRGIAIGYTPGVLTHAVAELTLALLLATSRRLFESHEAMLKGEWSAWSPTWMCGPGLQNSTVGIVGFGRIGQQVAKLIKPFGPSKILYTSRKRKDEEELESGAEMSSLDDLLKQSDFVIVTCALTDETKLLFNTEKFSRMKPSAIFINTSRGGVVDQDALINALKMKQIAAAGLDVMTPEPIPTDHPLLQLKNCVVIPHIGSASIDTRREMAILTAKNIIAGIEGKPLPAQL